MKTWNFFGNMWQQNIEENVRASPSRTTYEWRPCRGCREVRVEVASQHTLEFQPTPQKTSLPAEKNCAQVIEKKNFTVLRTSCSL